MKCRLLCVALLLAGLSACAHIAPRWISNGPRATEQGVHFSFYAPTAMRVQIAGSWPENNWAQGDASAGEADIGLMTDDNNDGLWEIVVPLPPGRHQYVFWVDENTWQLDPGNTEEVPGGPAQTASLIVVVVREGEYQLR